MIKYDKLTNYWNQIITELKQDIVYLIGVLNGEQPKFETFVQQINVGRIINIRADLNDFIDKVHDGSRNFVYCFYDL